MIALVLICVNQYTQPSFANYQYLLNLNIYNVVLP